MARKVLYLALVALVYGLWQAQAAEPVPTPSGVHLLSLREAVSLSVKHLRSGQDFSSCSQPLERRSRTNKLLLQVEVAYWNLYLANKTLQTREDGIRQASRTLERALARYTTGKGPAAEVDQTLRQRDQFCKQQQDALTEVKAQEKELRQFLGLPTHITCRLIPCDPPTTSFHKPDWPGALAEALVNRAELNMVRKDVAAAQTLVEAAKQVQAVADCWPCRGAIRGILASLLPEPPEAPWPAFHRLTNSPDPAQAFGCLKVQGIVRAARVHEAHATERLHDVNWQTESFLALHYRRLHLNHATVRATRASRQACAAQMRLCDREYWASRGTLDALLKSQRAWAASVVSETAALAAYNNALAGFAFGKGMVMERHRLFPDDRLGDQFEPTR